MLGICSAQIALSPNDFSSRVGVFPREGRVWRDPVRAWLSTGEGKKKNLSKSKEDAKPWCFHKTL